MTQGPSALPQWYGFAKKQLLRPNTCIGWACPPEEKSQLAHLFCKEKRFTKAKEQSGKFAQKPLLLPPFWKRQQKSLWSSTYYLFLRSSLFRYNSYPSLSVDYTTLALQHLFIDPSNGNLIINPQIIKLFLLQELKIPSIIYLEALKSCN